MFTTPAQVTIDVRASLGSLRAALLTEAAHDLTKRPKELSPTWLYDDVGCSLFERITGLPEYYPARTERAIIADYATEIIEATAPSTVVELGAGTADKTRILLDAASSVGSLRRYVPTDVAENAVRGTASAIASAYPGIAVHGIVGDFRDEIPGGFDGNTLVVFLGGTMGNLLPAARHRLLRSVASILQPGDGFLLGTDLVKDRNRLIAAYDDSAGVTASFNKNVLRVLNRELAADFDLDSFRHVVRYDAANAWIEMHLEASRPLTVTSRRLGQSFMFDAGETIRTEISAKFQLGQVAAELQDAGFGATFQWTDPAADYAVTLSRI